MISLITVPANMASDTLAVGGQMISYKFLPLAYGLIAVLIGAVIVMILFGLFKK